MCMCIYIYTHIYIYMYIHISMYTCIGVSMHLCMYVCMYRCMYVGRYIYIYICIQIAKFLKVCFPGGLGTHWARYPLSRCTPRSDLSDSLVRERGSAPKGGRHSTTCVNPQWNAACQVSICAVAAWWFDNPHQKVVPRSRIPRSTSHFSH